MAMSIKWEDPISWKEPIHWRAPMKVENETSAQRYLRERDEKRVK
jgi:hypothetical protein